MSDMEYNTSSVDNTHPPVDKPNEKGPEKAQQVLPGQSLRTLRAARKIGRMIEEDKMRDDLQDKLSEERIARRRSTGQKEHMDKYKPKDGKYESSIMNFITSSDPLSGFGDQLTETLDYKALQAEYAGRHKLTEVRMTRSFGRSGMSDNEARMLATLITNENKHGNQTLDSARDKMFKDQYNRDNGLEPSMI